MIIPYAVRIKTYILNPESDSFNQATPPIAPPSDRWMEFTGADCDSRDGKIIFGTHGTNCILQTRINDSDTEAVVCSEMNPLKNLFKGNLQDLTVDWISKNVYVTAYSLPDEGYLQVVNLKNPGVIKTLVTGLYRPESVVVHPTKGFVFIQEHFSNNSNSIVRTNLDGSGFVKFLSPEISHIEELVIDFETDRVYWSDGGYNEGIKHMDLNGQDIKVLSNQLMQGPFHLGVYKNTLLLHSNSYFSPNGIYSFDKINGTLIKDYSQRIETYSRGNKVCSRSQQKINPDHPCLNNNGGCQQFCFAVPNNTSDYYSFINVCRCSDDQTLNSNWKTCA